MGLKNPPGKRMAEKMLGLKEKCVGCRMCELACSLNLETVFNPKLSRVQVERGGNALDLPHICFQCDDAPCAEVCPVEAITMNEATGIWHIDRDTCTACGLCVEACPYGAMFMEPEGEYALKCEVCEGQYCKTICPSEAIVHQA